jgi:hypothetical protein
LKKIQVPRFFAAHIHPAINCAAASRAAISLSNLVNFFRTPPCTSRLKTRGLLGSFGNRPSFLIAGQGFQLPRCCRNRVYYAGVSMNVNIHSGRCRQALALPHALQRFQLVESPDQSKSRMWPAQSGSGNSGRVSESGSWKLRPDCCSVFRQLVTGRRCP